jgi:hypothetical protein
MSSDLRKAGFPSAEHFMYSSSGNLFAPSVVPTSFITSAAFSPVSFLLIFAWPSEKAHYSTSAIFD